ncbi:hypothetical protein NPIL_98171 [Nephila pilipes]|uniref:Uncharacterized protein n=1 Tax=Nephila pilipes TaxID=299642 RepID=A0A8X6IMR5_NEPPI|nr:hypothetical protein NPIL_98171 [Nephila pilipes]
MFVHLNRNALSRERILPTTDSAVEGENAKHTAGDFIDTFDNIQPFLQTIATGGDLVLPELVGVKVNKGMVMNCEWALLSTKESLTEVKSRHPELRFRAATA